MQTFSVIALVGLILFMFIMGMELDQVRGGQLLVECFSWGRAMQ